MRLHGLRFELRMELAPQKPRMPRDLANLHIRPVGSLPGNLQPRRLQRLLILPIELESVTMPFADLARTIRLARKTVLRQHARPRAEPHRAPQLVDALQLPQLENDAMRRRRIELR